MSDAQKANVSKLKDDLSAIKAGSSVTPEQKKALADSLRACVDGATKPSAESVKTLASDLSDAVADGHLSNKEKAELSHDVSAILNSANIPPEEAAAVIQNARNVLTSAGVSRGEVDTVVKDLQAIAQELKKNSGRIALLLLAS